MTIWQWADAFSDISPEFQVTLGEGNTPLVASKQIGPSAGLDHLYFKLESCNPTGSYKDRFASAAISDMRSNGKTRVVGTSSGNTGSSVAAYCAAAGIPAEIAIVETAPPGKLHQMLAYGASLYQVKGMGMDPNVSKRAMEILQRKADRPDSKLQISAFRFAPEGMAGVQTISYELAAQAEAAEHAIDQVFVPAGGGGLAIAVARGFEDPASPGTRYKKPAVHCVQPSGNDTIAGPLREGADRARSVNCTSKISGLQVANVIDGDEAIVACRRLGGTGYLVDDQETWDVQKRLAREEGIFCEPAGAVAVAGALAAARAGELPRDHHTVALVTGIGFKDPPSIDLMIADMKCPMITVEQIEEQ